MDPNDLFCLNLNHNGVYFNAQMDRSTYEVVTADPQLLQQYTEEIYKQSFQNLGADTAKENKPETSFDNKPQLKVESTDFKWTNQLIKLLYHNRLEMEEQFTNPKCKKIKYWMQIANKINKKINVGVTAEACSSKYRNLLATYRANKRRQQSTGEGAINWEYFEDFDRVLGTKVSSGIPPVEFVGGSLQPITSTEVDADEAGPLKHVDAGPSKHVEAGPSKHVEAGPSSQKMKIERKRRTSAVSFQTYLAKRIAQQDDQKQKEEEKKATEERRWQEKKELKEKEINAILELAKAIAEKK